MRPLVPFVIDKIVDVGLGGLEENDVDKVARNRAVSIFQEVVWIERLNDGLSVLQTLRILRFEPLHEALHIKMRHDIPATRGMIVIHIPMFARTVLACTS